MRPSLVTLVINHILDLISSGEFPPGSTLPGEDELAKMMNASRPTCREAIKVLSTQEVLRPAQGRGTFVNPVHKWISLEAILRMQDGNLEESMLQLIGLRTLIEIGAAELFAPLCGTDTVEQLETQLEAMRVGDRAGHVAKFVEADIAFHQIILDGCGNPFIPVTFHPIANALHEGRFHTSSVPEIRTNAIAEHGNIISALRTASPTAAGEAMRSHLEQTRRDALHFLSSIATT